MCHSLKEWTSQHFLGRHHKSEKNEHSLKKASGKNGCEHWTSEHKDGIVKALVSEMAIALWFIDIWVA